MWKISMESQHFVNLVSSKDSYNNKKKENSLFNNDNKV